MVQDDGAVDRSVADSRAGGRVERAEVALEPEGIAHAGEAPLAEEGRSRGPGGRVVRVSRRPVPGQQSEISSARSPTASTLPVAATRTSPWA